MPKNSCSYVLIYLLPVDLTFGRLDDIVSHLGGQIPKKTPERGLNRHFIYICIHQIR